MSDQLKQLLDVPREFFKDGAYFLNRCTKPDKRGTHCGPFRRLQISPGVGLIVVDCLEFLEISRAVAVGFLVMGFIGFAVKLIHIPINNILVKLLKKANIY
jgi:protein transport protein SEC61 subunit gamma-like protein